jgi:heme a synthase
MEHSSAWRLLLIAGFLAGVPLCWWWARNRRGDARARVLALAMLTAFLTFDLIVFGAFTRLTDSGLGCPDWPGCYGHASPLGASQHIEVAQAAMPTGPVTETKAWIEMIHRYLAMTVGALIIVLLLASLRHKRAGRLDWRLPAFTLFWVIVQGMFGKYTVTLKLQPIIVTLHLLGGMVLLGLLVAQCERLRGDAVRAAPLPKRWLIVGLAACLVQMALGAWVSSNYAVLACQGFPQCNGDWWPAMDLSEGFHLTRELGRASQGAYLPMQALVAVHWVHRAFALVVVVAVGGLAWLAWRQAAWRVHGKGLAGLLALQLATGMSNVVLQWPIAMALLHTAGAALIWAVLVSLAQRSRDAGS